MKKEAIADQVPAGLSSAGRPSHSSFAGTRSVAKEDMCVFVFTLLFFEAVRFDQSVRTGSQSAQLVGNVDLVAWRGLFGLGKQFGNFLLAVTTASKLACSFSTHKSQLLQVSEGGFLNHNGTRPLVIGQLLLSILFVVRDRFRRIMGRNVGQYQATYHQVSGIRRNCQNLPSVRGPNPQTA